MSFPHASWVSNTNVYEVNTRQYTPEGTFRAFMAHIPRLKDMGVHTLWFMPVTPISTYRRKGSLGSYYACADYMSVNPEFGTLDDFRALVRMAHGMGMKVIIDWVANHTGADHVWTVSHPEYYIRNEAGEFYDRHGWDDVIDLDHSNPDMRREMISCMRFWVRETGIDGFRCDMAMLVPVDFWAEARSALDAEQPLFWLAECDQWEHPQYLEVFDAAYTWAWMHAAEAYYRSGPSVQRMKETLNAYRSLQPVDAIKAWFTSNHDENSWNGTEYEKYGDMAIPLAVLSCTWEGIPLIYSGQEIPNGKRLTFFDKDQLDWPEIPSLHDFYRILLGLRASHPALLADPGSVRTTWLHTDHADKVMAFRRVHDAGELLVLVNFSPYLLDLHIDPPGLPFREYTNVFSDTQMSMGTGVSIDLPAWGYFVLRS